MQQLLVVLLKVNINGTRSITNVIDENRYIVSAGAAANTSEDGGGFIQIVTHAPTTEWMEQSYSELRGYPAAVGFHENRLWFGGTLSQPDTVWASKSGLYIITLILVMPDLMMIH